MGLTQIAFDFDDAPAPKPEPQKKAPVLKKKPELVQRPPVAVKSNRGRKSLQAKDSGMELVEIPEDEVLFSKLYYSIGDVAGMFKVNASLIRLWENEFDVLQPRKNRKGDRLFRPEDIKNLKLIYHLVREKKYTMQGAKDFIRNNKKTEEKFAMIEGLKKLRGFLCELKAGL